MPVTSFITENHKFKLSWANSGDTWAFGHSKGTLALKQLGHTGT